ncbi:hypothetical protein ACIPJG_32125 [Streptomyces halstedii]|uniref:hypothetical protein n=1 Tax=Streptomyces halstedii TaxID=1944 RepID=UPI0037FEBA9D
MPDTGLTNEILKKYFYMGLTDQQIADQFHISRQAVAKRRVEQNLRRIPVSTYVNKSLGLIWNIKSAQEGYAHHNAHEGKALKAFLRMQLKDPKLSEGQQELALQWANNLRRKERVLCYDRNTDKGWYYRPRTEADGARVIDWPKEVPFPDEKFKRALDLPADPS